ncbi:MAG: ABC transporter permease [Armatimonadetes bacterium]|nr:ABC transporter permease [Armatimonadota bacterium]
MVRLRRLLEQVGAELISLIQFVGETVVLTVETFRYVFTGAHSPRQTIRQMGDIGFSSLPIVLVTVGFSGMVLALYTATEFLKLEAGSYVGGLVALSIAREIGPVVTSIVVAARVGSAIAAELGTMKVTEQIDALRALATSPVEYLVVPRFLACVTMLPVLGVLAGVTGTVGGALVAVYAGVPWAQYLSSIQKMVDLGDVFTGLAKTIPFAVIISILGCHQGLYARGGAAGVGRATTSSVVLCIISIYAADFFLSAILPR